MTATTRHVEITASTRTLFVSFRARGVELDARLRDRAGEATAQTDDRSARSDRGPPRDRTGQAALRSAANTLVKSCL